MPYKKRKTNNKHKTTKDQHTNKPSIKPQNSKTNPKRIDKTHLFYKTKTDIQTFS